MADDAQPRRPAGPEPVSDAKKHANKLVVLSSVAKPPLNEDESLLGETPGGAKPAPPAKPEEGLIRPVGWTTRPGGTTTIIKLPPKTGVLPRLTSLSQKGPVQPPPLPVTGAPARSEDEGKRLPPIRLQPSTLPGASESESIFSIGGETSPSPEGSTMAPPPLPASVEKKSGTQALPNTVLISRSPQMSTPEEIARAAQQHPGSLIHHAPPLVAPEASAPASEEDVVPKGDAPMSSSVEMKQAEPEKTPTAPLEVRKPEAVSTVNVPLGEQVTQRLLPIPAVEIKPPAFNEVRTMRLPPRAAVSGRLKEAPAMEGAPGTTEKPSAATTPPKVFPVTPSTIPIRAEPATGAPLVAAIPPAATVQAPIKATVTPPTIPLRPAPERAKTSPVPVVAGAAGSAAAVSAARLAEERAAILERSAKGGSSGGEKKPPVPSTRAARLRKRRIVGIVAFYILFIALLPCLYFAAIYFSQETRVEGQVIPPPGMVLANQVEIVTDFRELASGISNDLASDRLIVMQDMQEKLGHVQRAQADVAAREARIRSLTDQIKAATQAQFDLVKQARDASQHVWDGPGADLDADYQSKLAALNQAIADRAKANHLQYAPDPNYFSPEVWANAYRLALYQVPAGVDATKERLWLDEQMKNWHDFTKSMDQQQNELREKATQLKLAPASKVADLKSQIDDLQSRIDGTITEEEPIKAELEQARADLAVVQAKEAGLDAKPMEKLDALPEANVTRSLPLSSRGRFSWREVQKESKYDEDEKSHVYWIFVRAYRPDGRQYWALHRFTVEKNRTVEIMIEPDSFISTKAILRPDLSPDEQEK
jgi:hypothetical protein